MLSSDHIRELNKRYSDSILFEGLTIVRDPSAAPVVIDRFANYSDQFTLDGDVYVPLEMVFQGRTNDISMSLPIASVSMSNVGNQVIDYIEDDENGVVLDHNDVTMLVVQRTRLGVFSLVESVQMQVLVIVDNGDVATMQLGLNVRLEDKLPAKTIEITEFPGIKGNALR